MKHYQVHAEFTAAADISATQDEHDTLLYFANDVALAPRVYVSEVVSQEGEEAKVVQLDPRQVRELSLLVLREVIERALRVYVAALGQVNKLDAGLVMPEPKDLQ